MIPLGPFVGHYICMGFERSTTRRWATWGVDAMLLGLYVDGELQEVGQVSTMTDEARQAFYERPDNYLGRVAEVDGTGVRPGGMVRHPTFRRFRGDKPPQSCTLAAILALRGAR